MKQWLWGPCSTHLELADGLQSTGWMVSEAALLWPRLPHHSFLKERNETSLAEAGLKQTGFPPVPCLPHFQKVRRRRREGNNYCHRLHLLRQIHTHLELEKPPAEKERRALPGLLSAPGGSLSTDITQVLLVQRTPDSPEQAPFPGEWLTHLQQERVQTAGLHNACHGTLIHL